jgi:hypothetical protein
VEAVDGPVIIVMKVTIVYSRVSCMKGMGLIMSLRTETLTGASAGTDIEDGDGKVPVLQVGREVVFRLSLVALGSWAAAPLSHIDNRIPRARTRLHIR